MHDKLAQLAYIPVADNRGMTAGPYNELSRLLCFPVEDAAYFSF